MREPDQTICPRVRAPSCTYAERSWEDSLDDLARGMAFELERRGLLASGAASEVRFHLRGYGRRIATPLLEAAVEAGHSSARALTARSRREPVELAARVIAAVGIAGGTAAAALAILLILA